MLKIPEFWEAVALAGKPSLSLPRPIRRSNWRGWEINKKSFKPKNFSLVKNKLVQLKSIISLKDKAAVKSNRIKESLLHVAEEVAAWMLAGDFF